jgi:hypothetical protein
MALSSALACRQAHQPYAEKAFSGSSYRANGADSMCWNGSRRPMAGLDFLSVRAPALWSPSCPCERAAWLAPRKIETPRCLQRPCSASRGSFRFAGKDVNKERPTSRCLAGELHEFLHFEGGDANCQSKPAPCTHDEHWYGQSQAEEASTSGCGPVPQEGRQQATRHSGAHTVVRWTGAILLGAVLIFANTQPAMAAWGFKGKGGGREAPRPASVALTDEQQKRQVRFGGLVLFFWLVFQECHLFVFGLVG